MSERRPSRPELWLGFLCAVGWGAVAFAATGVLSWALDREPVAQPVGPGFAFAAAAASGLLVWLVAAFSVSAPRPWLGMAAAAAGSYLAICAVAFVVGLGLLIEQASSPFVITAALLAPGAVLLCRLAARHDPRSRG